MSFVDECAQKVLVRNQSVTLFLARLCGQSCAHALVKGDDGLRSDLAASVTTVEWLDPDTAEGGYLIDFDLEEILAYSRDDERLRAALPKITAAWSGWRVRVVGKGVPDFQEYLAAQGHRWDSIAHQICPICGARTRPNRRYPDYVCTSCLSDGVVVGGSHVALQELNVHAVRFVKCEVAGVRCYAREAHFGGTVVLPGEPPESD